MTGQVLLDGKELKDYPLYQIGQQVGSVFQNPRTQFYNVDTTSEIVFGCENMALPVPEMHPPVPQGGGDQTEALTQWRVAFGKIKLFMNFLWKTMKLYSA